MGGQVPVSISHLGPIRLSVLYYLLGAFAVESLILSSASSLDAFPFAFIILDVLFW